jgi:hypothetical protein
VCYGLPTVVLRCEFYFAALLLGGMVPYASALNVRIWKLMMNARPEPEHLTMFVEDCCSLDSFYYDALHIDLLTLSCNVASLI